MAWRGQCFEGVGSGWQTHHFFGQRHVLPCIMTSASEADFHKMQIAYRLVPRQI